MNPPLVSRSESSDWALPRVVPHCKPHVIAKWSEWRQLAWCGKCHGPVSASDVMCSLDEAWMRRRAKRRRKSKVQP